MTEMDSPPTSSAGDITCPECGEKIAVPVELGYEGNGNFAILLDYLDAEAHLLSHD